MEIFLVVVQLLIVFGALWLGSRYGSLALGAISGIGLALLVFGFGMKPGTPPTDVIYIIIAAITCAGMMQASGGMDWLIQLTEKLLRRKPEMITFLAPLSTFLLTVLVGTGHVVYTLMPIICDISLKKGIRPERPCAVASIASQMGIMASPISAAVVAFVSISNMNGFDVTIPQVLMVSLPACLIGLLAASLCSFKRGKDLDKDPDFQARLKDPEQYNYIYGHSATTLDKEIPLKSKSAVYVFAASLLLIVMFAIFPQLLPSWNGEQLKMNIVIQIVMLVAAALMIIISGAKPKEAVQGPVWQSGMAAVVSIYGIAWMADTFLGHYMSQLESTLGGLVGAYPWMISIVFFVVSILINSQGAVVVAMLPLAYQLGIPGPVLLGVLPTIYGYFFIPTYPSDVATVNFDRSGTTRIGKYLLNHSFMMPGLVSVGVATLVAYLLTMLIY
ncbi:MAG: anaerobic C4-dicarboxylate transporter [Paludibacteraceae bacterium]|nr:anaerobic C4-dicarboxylate transporter [Paludibacteraceae bacterium]